MKLDIKRFYVPFPMELNCIECGHTDTSPSNEHYISYPDTEKNNYLYWCCINCGEDLQMKIDFDVKINPQFCSISKQ